MNLAWQGQCFAMLFIMEKHAALVFHGIFGIVGKTGAKGELSDII